MGDFLRHIVLGGFLAGVGEADFHEQGFVEFAKVEAHFAFVEVRDYFAGFAEFGVVIHGEGLFAATAGPHHG